MTLEILLYSLCSILGLQSTAGDWYYVNTNIPYNNECTPFVKGSHGIWDRFCGYDSHKYLALKNNETIGDTFISTTSKVGNLSILLYFSSCLLVTTQLLIPTFYKFKLFLSNTVISSGVCMLLYWFINHANRDQVLSSKLNIIQVGVISTISTLLIQFYLVAVLLKTMYILQ